MTHRRSPEAIERRQLRKLVKDTLLNRAYEDHFQAETVNLLTRDDLITIIKDMGNGVDFSVIPADLIRGEILVDSRGRGSIGNTIQVFEEEI